METTTATTTINYIGEYYKNKDTDAFSTFFTANSLIGNNKITELEKTIKALQAQLDEEEGKLTKEYSKRYAGKYAKPERPVYLLYDDRNRVQHYFTLSGQGVDLDEDKVNHSYIFPLCTKNGEVCVLGGYAYELGSILVHTYKYNISSDNATIKLKLLSEKLIDVFSKRKIDNRDAFIKDATYDSDAEYFQLDYFFGTLYGRELSLGWKYNDYIRAMRENKSFETIIKTAPHEIMRYVLRQTVKENGPVYKILGISKEEYQEACDRHLITDVYKLDKYIVNKAMFNLTCKDWMDLINIYAKTEKDLDFYSIKYKRYSYYSISATPDCANLLESLAQAYVDYEEIRKYYSFRKFADYAVDAAINQGYTSMDSFFGELRDYLRMCNRYKAKPTLNNECLEMSHNLLARNHSINITPDDEVKFTTHYEDFKSYTKGKYIIFAPTRPQDLILEGDQQNSCTGSLVRDAIDGKRFIYFLRYATTPNESLVTFEIEDGVITEAKQAHNHPISDEERECLEKFCEDRGYTYAPKR